MKVLFLSPQYPPEMPSYVRGLAEVGAQVYGVGDAPKASLRPEVRRYLTGYLEVPRIMDEADLTQRVRAWVGPHRLDRVETQWEPLVLAAARLREALGVPGMSYDTVLGFRDKQLMKERVAAAGLRVPRARRCRSAEAMWEAAEEVGFPLIVKPIAGAGSADTYRVDDAQQFAQVVRKVQHVQEVSVEEFVDGEEFTYDTICVEGRPVMENVAQYLPRPLVARTEQWISPIICTVRDLAQPALTDGLTLGRAVLGALQMGTGYTHMEWYKKSNGEVVFGEIGCRPGGAHLVDQMNFTSDTDHFREWARAVCWHTTEIHRPRRYNCAIIFKRALGEGVITRVTGLEEFRARAGEALCWENLLQPGQHRRDWKKTLVSDGFLMIRHPTWRDALAIADDAARNVTLYAS